MPSEPRNTESTEDHADELLFECLERVANEGQRALEAMCEEHPNHARAIREGFKRLVSMGLVDGDSQLPPEFPEQLGDFRLIRRIGGGGMGVVYLAEQMSQSRRVALKVIRPDKVYYPQDVARFRREVEAIAKLRHPGIVSVISVGQDREIPFFAMEWLEGSTLYEVLRRFDGRRAEELRGEDLWKAVIDLRGPAADPSEESDPPTEIPPLFQGTWCDACIRIAREIAEVLHYSHKRGIIHRDIKPSNIWMTPAGRTVLIDFGLARSRDATQLTRTGAQLGSLLYMSPEQVSGSTAIDERTDVYSLGVTLYESLAFRSPFEANSTEVTVQRIVLGDARAPRVWNPAIPKNAQTVCLTAMNRQAKARYRGAAEFSRDLANVLARLPIEARNPSWVSRAHRWTERHPAGAVGLLLLSSLIFFALFTAVRERAALRRYQLLSDSHWITKLTLEARSFWPMDLKHLEDIDRWCKEVAQVRKQHAIHKHELVAIRENALPYTLEAEQIDRAPTEKRIAGLRNELRILEELIERGENPEAFNKYNAAELVDLRQLIEEMRTNNVRKTWTFSTRSEEWRHQMLTRLIETEYRDIVELEDKVREHRRQIQSVHKESILDRADEWKQAISEIATLEVYRGLQIEPQIGLRPLRRNPRTGLWEFLHVISGAAPRNDATDDDHPDRLVIDEESGMVMVLLPGGVCQIGARPTENELEAPVLAASLIRERPMYSVTLDPFFISKHELTVAQFARLGGTLHSTQHPSALPIDNHRDAFLDILNRTWLELPTEAQWEYACRAGTSSAFSTGNSIASLEYYANLGGHSHFSPASGTAVSESTTPFVDLAPVGRFLPNRFGLYDMHGNIREWTADVFIGRAYTTMTARPGDGLRYFARNWEKDLPYTVRGGDCWGSAVNARSARRIGVAAGIRWQRPGARPMRRLRPG